MRRVTYGNRGRPRNIALDLEELVLILQGAIESVDAERFVLERDQREAPQELSEYARAGSYEVSVVGRFHTLSQRWLERQKLAAVWERPVAKRSSGSGRHPTIDISLFGEVAPVNDGLRLRSAKCDWSLASSRSLVRSDPRPGAWTHPSFGATQRSCSTCAC